MSILERIIEEVRALPPHEQQRLREILNREQQTAERARRVDLSRQIRGKYAHIIKTSSDDYVREKAEETAVEDRRRQA